MTNSGQVWDRSKAIKVGELLVEQGMQRKLTLAVAVFLDDQRVYHYALEGTSSENDLWFDRKRRTVDLTKMSSLDYRRSILASGISEEMLPLTDGLIAICGGGEPLIDHTGYRGVAIVSGLPHLDDAEMVHAAVLAIAEEEGIH